MLHFHAKTDLTDYHKIFTHIFWGIKKDIELLLKKMLSFGYNIKKRLTQVHIIKKHKYFWDFAGKAVSGLLVFLIKLNNELLFP